MPTYARALCRVIAIALVAVTIGMGVVGASSEPANAQAACSAMSTVTSEVELNAAIACYNAQTPVGNHTITLGSSFGLTGLTTFISQNDAAVSLVIEGGGNTITGSGTVTNEVALVVSGAGPVTIQNIAITNTVRAAVATVPSAGVVNITNASLTGNLDDGIAALAGSVTVSNSTISASGDDGIAVSGAALTVSNSTLANNSTGLDISSGSSATVSNSTVSANGTGVSNSGAITVTSNLLVDNTTDCTGSGYTDGGNNLGCGGFFGTLDMALGPLQDNGCVVPLASGCVQTMALAAGSNAVAAGNCASVTTDERGAPRGMPCDIGAFEIPSFPLTLTKTLNGPTPLGVWQFTISASTACVSVNGAVPVSSGTATAPAAGGASTDVIVVDDGCTITITETAVPGYTASAVTCVVTPFGGTPGLGVPATALAITGATACEVTNDADNATVTLTKSVIGAAAVGDFTLTATLSGGAATNFVSGVAQGIPAGSYVLSETGPAGYSASVWTCVVTPVGGNQMPPVDLVGGAILLAPGDIAACEITNTQLPGTGDITIGKTWVGATGPAIDFVVSPEVADCGAVQTVTLPAGAVMVTATVADISSDGTATACTYTVTENAPAAYAATQTVFAGVAPGATVAFINTQLPGAGDITIGKTWVGATGPAIDFVVSPEVADCGAVQTVTLPAGAVMVTATVADISSDGTATACTYTVTENAPAAYAATQTVFAGVAPGATVAFINTQLPGTGDITIAKTWVGATGPAIDFVVSPEVADCGVVQTVTLPAGAVMVTATVADISSDGTATACTYTVAETVPAGWVASTASVASVAPGSMVPFTNTQEPGVGQVMIIKTVIGNLGINTEFAVSSSQPGCVATPAAVTIAGSGSAVVDVADITNDGLAVACSYTVTETPVAGYTPDSVTQSAGPGAAVTFTNTQDVVEPTVTPTAIPTPTPVPRLPYPGPFTDGGEVGAGPLGFGTGPDFVVIQQPTAPVMVDVTNTAGGGAPIAVTGLNSETTLQIALLFLAAGFYTLGSARRFRRDD